MAGERYRGKNLPKVGAKYDGVDDAIYILEEILMRKRYGINARDRIAKLLHAVYNSGRDAPPEVVPLTMYDLVQKSKG